MWEVKWKTKCRDGPSVRFVAQTRVDDPDVSVVEQEAENHWKNMWFRSESVNQSDTQNSLNVEFLVVDSKCNSYQ